MTPAGNPRYSKNGNPSPSFQQDDHNYMNKNCRVPCARVGPPFFVKRHDLTSFEIFFEANRLDFSVSFRQSFVMNLVEIQPRKNFRLFVRYDDGISGEVNLSGFVGKGVFSAWEAPEAFEKVWLAEAGHPEWPGGIDLCPDSLYMQLTGKTPEQVFPTLKQIPTHA